MLSPNCSLKLHFNGLIQILFIQAQSRVAPLKKTCAWYSSALHLEVLHLGACNTFSLTSVKKKNKKKFEGPSLFILNITPPALLFLCSTWPSALYLMVLGSSMLLWQVIEAAHKYSFKHCSNPSSNKLVAKQLPEPHSIPATPFAS